MYKLEQILISIFLLLFAGSGLFVYLIVIRVLMTKFSKKSYFILASWLGIADCTFLIVTVCYVVPSILKGKLLYNSNMFGGIINIAWFSGLPIMLLLAGDRYLCMCHYKIHARIYSLNKTKIYCVLSWLFGISCGIPSFFSGCTLYYNMKIMSWRWDTDHYCATILSYVEISMVLGIVGVTCILTVLVLRWVFHYSVISFYVSISLFSHFLHTFMNRHRRKRLPPKRKLSLYLVNMVPSTLRNNQEKASFII